MRAVPTAFAFVLMAGHPHSGAADRQTVALGELQSLGHGVSVRPDRIVEDSRCPEEVLCVWAGRLVIDVTIMHPDGRERRAMTLGARHSIPSGDVTFATAPPRKLSMKQPDDYRFGFTFSPSAK